MCNNLHNLCPFSSPLQPSHGGYSQLVRDVMMKKDSQPVKLIVNMNELNGKKITTSSGNQIISVIRVISSSTSSVTPTTPKTITVSSSSSTTPTTMSVTPVTVSSQKNNHHTIVLDDSHLFKTPNKPVTVSVVSTGSKRRKISGSSPASSPSSSDSGVGSSGSGGLGNRSLPGVFSAFGATVSSFAGLNSYMSTRSSTGTAASTRIVVSKKVDEPPSTATRGKKAGAATAASKSSAPKEVETPSKAGRHRYETSLGQLTKKFISLLKEAPEGVSE